MKQEEVRNGWVPLCIDEVRYRGLIGVGGIGAGVFFALDGNHTLGREESRGGHYLDRRDYCKLHIVCHYVATLLGRSFETLAIGKVGADDVGRRLLAELGEAGINTRHTSSIPGHDTLFSFCFVYPDGSGGNLTTDDSASAAVDASFVQHAEPDIARLSGQGLAVALPEVPLEARAALLELASQHGLLRVASFTSEELRAAADQDLLSLVDLLALNMDETAALARRTPDEATPERIIRVAVDRLREITPAILLSVTDGDAGSWSWDGSSLSHQAAHPVSVAGAAGAGDAHLAGTLVGLVAGLGLHSATELGALVAGMAVTSPHTIHKGIDRASLRQFAIDVEARIDTDLWALLGT
jgi:sugar/nucleoside kinase (ribokinase family)